MGVEAKPLVAADATLEEVRAFFARDRYATVACGAAIEQARPGYARVSLAIGENHLNGMGSLMGGVSFTMADFAFAVAANVGGAPTVSTNCRARRKPMRSRRSAASKKTAGRCASRAWTCAIPRETPWRA